MDLASPAVSGTSVYANGLKLGRLENRVTTVYLDLMRLFKVTLNIYEGKQI